MSHMDLLPDDIRSGDGLMLTYELLEAGYSDRAITRMVRSGHLVRIRHGAYVAGAVWQDLGERARRHLIAIAAYRQAKAHVLLSHTSAADALGAPVWDLASGSHLTRTDQKAGRREAGVTQHRGSIVVDDVTVRDGLQLTSGTRTALDCTTLAGVEQGLVIVNGLLHLRETTSELLAQRYASMRHWPSTLTTELVLRLADGRCESAGESRTLHLLWKQHLPSPQPQYLVRNSRGVVVARVDFAWPEFGVFLEFDGKVKYLRHLREGETPAQAVIREKRREELVCGITGWRCIRIVWSDLHRPKRTADRIRATLEGRVWAA